MTATTLSERRASIDDPMSRAMSASAMAPQLRALVGASGHAPCRIVDARNEPGVRGVILYEVGNDLVLGVVPHGGGERDAGRAVDPSRLLTYRFPHDPALPGLTTLFDPPARRRLLGQALGPARLVHSRVTLLRYRPLRRCTLRLDVATRVAPDGPIIRTVLIAKAYHDVAKAETVYEQMQSLSASKRLAAAGLCVATPIAFLPQAAVVVQAPVAGRPFDDLILAAARGVVVRRREVEERVAQAAVALAALHGADPGTARPRDMAVRLQRMQHRADAVGHADPRLGAAMSRIAGSLADAFDRVGGWDARLRLVHGDCKPSQFLLHGTGIGLLDFDHCGLQDPAGDVGDFLASLRQLAIQRARDRRGSSHGWLGDLEAHFLHQYPVGADHSAEAFRKRALWHQSFALQRKAFRAFQRSWRSPLPAALVAEAEHCLSLVGGGDP